MENNVESHVIPMLGLLAINFPSSAMSSFALIPLLDLINHLQVQWLVVWFCYCFFGYLQWFVIFPWVYKMLFRFNGNK